MIVEVFFARDQQQVRFARAYALAHIADQMYGAGKRDEAWALWTKGLAEGATIEDAIAPARAEATGTDRFEPSVRLAPLAVSPLWLYHDLAESVYRAGGQWPDAERAISRLADKRIDEPSTRAMVLIASAGRLYAADRSAANNAWQNAVAAASEIREGEAGGEAGSRPPLAEPIRIATRHEEFAQIQDALARTRDSGIRSRVFSAVALTMIRYARAEREPQRRAARLAAALEIARGMSDEQWRRGFLQQSAQELLKRSEPGADTFLAELREEARVTRDDTARSSQLAWLAKLEAQPRQFGRARRLCWPPLWLSIAGGGSAEGCLSEDKLYVAVQILWEYEARDDSRIREIMQRRATRYPG